MIEINNLTDFELKEEKQKNINLSIAFVKSDKIREVNKKYRDKDNPTDVLSFGSIEDDFAEIVICPEVLGEDNLLEKVSFCLIHGVLHILGYEHKKGKKKKETMYNLHKKYLNNF